MCDCVLFDNALLSLVRDCFLCILMFVELAKHPSELTRREEEAAVSLKLPFGAECPPVRETKSVVIVEANVQAVEPTGLLSPSSNDAAVIHSGTSLLPPSPCSDTMPVHLSVVSSASSTAAGCLSTTAAVVSRSPSPRDTGRAVSPASTGSNDVFVTSSAPNSPLAPSVELAADGQGLPSSVIDADAAFVTGSTEVTRMSETQQLHSGLFDNVSRLSSPSESDSEPLGGCQDALTNPDHCISDLYLEDNEDDIGTAGLQSVAVADSLDRVDNCSRSSAVDAELSGSRVERDCRDASDLDVFSFSHSRRINSHMQNDSTCDEPQINSCMSSSIDASPFRSPLRSPVHDDGTSLYSYIVPVDSSSPFRSPPRSTAKILEGKRLWNRTSLVEDLPTAKVMLPSHNAVSSDSATGNAVLTVCGEHSVNGVTKRDDIALAEGVAHVSEIRGSRVASPDAQYKCNWTSESPAAQSNGVSFPVGNQLESRIDYCGGRIRFQNRSLPWSDVYSTGREDRWASVKQLKSKFESQQDLASSQLTTRSSQNLASVPSAVESVAPFKLPEESTPPVKKSEDRQCSETTRVDCTNFSSSNAVDTEEQRSPFSPYKTIRSSIRECRQLPISVKISCFEPVMSATLTGCQKENKRARLSSSDSATHDHMDKKLSCSSDSVKEQLTNGRDIDTGRWFVGSPQRDRAKPYQRCSSAGHEDLLALLNIPAASAKTIPRVSERKRLFELETGVNKANSSRPASLVVNTSPVKDRYSREPQRLPSVDKENSLRGQVKSHRSLFEGTSACQLKNNAFESDPSGEVDRHSFKYSINQTKMKGRYLQAPVPLKSYERFKLT